MRSFSQIYIMAVFGVKFRLGLIDRAWKLQLYSVMGNTLNNINGTAAVRIGGIADHVHVLFSTQGFVAEAEIIRKLKSDSSRWINEHRLTVGRFAWQDGNARFSYSVRDIAQIIRYIDNQEEHHRRLSFREELDKLLLHSGMAYNGYNLPDEPA